jgi:teichoic acid transport system permease protein
MDIVLDFFKYREILFDLIKRDIKNKHLGSYLGFFWVFIQPLFTLLILWAVFSFGLRVKSESKVPFILWLMTGLIPWNFLSEGILSSANSILENSFLVKKIVFRVSLLPIIKVLSSSFIHFFFLVILILANIFSGNKFDIYGIQILYYFICGVTLIFFLSFITSSVIIFFKDLGQILSLLIQFLFWLTPIFWSFTSVPEKYRFLLSFNPFFYIIEGYRDSLINKVWFWEKGNQTIIFFLLNLLIAVFGIFIFKKLRPHFADVI